MMERVTKLIESTPGADHNDWTGGVGGSVAWVMLKAGAGGVGTLTLYDSLTQTGTKIAPDFAVAANQAEVFRFAPGCIPFSIGLSATANPNLDEYAVGIYL